MMIPRKKKAKTGVLRSTKSPKRVHTRHHGIQRYCVLYKKAGITEHKRRIVPMIALACAPTGPLSMDWEDLWEVGLML